MKITFDGTTMNLVGKQFQVGEQAPNFRATTINLSPFSLNDIKAKLKVISVVPSLDTPVCQIQTRKFNEHIAGLKDVVIITVSMDLPFAQQKFCSTEGIKEMTVISDYKEHDFANKYGLLIEELGLLTRAIIVLDKDNIVKYTEYIEEITGEPNYEKVLEFVKSVN